MSKNILIVDDDEGILDALSMVLEDAGFMVETTSKGNQTFKKINKFKPNLILLDVLLSGEDGRFICKMLKQDNETREIPVVMISAHPSAKTSIKEYGADSFLAKPFSTEVLLKTINEFTS
jgi:DNA-binding response OmpR family regulator